MSSKINVTSEFYNVMSSNILGIGYIEGLKLLYVMFNNFAVYTYDNISLAKWEAFKSAPSKGKYLHKYIKTGILISRVEQLETQEDPVIQRTEC